MQYRTDALGPNEERMKKNSKKQKSKTKKMSLKNLKTVKAAGGHAVCYTYEQARKTPGENDV